MCQIHSGYHDSVLVSSRKLCAKKELTLPALTHERKYEERAPWVAGHGVGVRPSARMGGDVRKGGRAAGIPVGRRQGRRVGQVRAGARGEFARTAGVGRGELGANAGMAHFWRVDDARVDVLVNRNAGR